MRRHRPSRRRTVRALGASVLAAAALTAATAPSAAGTVRVLRVGSWHGIPGNEPTIAAALADARPGDWILVGPGDYHPRADYDPSQAGAAFPAAVLVTTPDLHLRGMDRNAVVVDGTRPGAPACSAAPGDQDYGPPDANGKPRGRNGIEALFADGLTVENLTVCNFLSGSGNSGNEIWWNGGDDTGTVGMGTWWGNWLSATSTFYDPKHPDTSAQYGLFVSNARGPGSMSHTYASNFSDSGYYIGACPDCNAEIDDAHAQYNALGYSGTNSGGHLVVRNSEFDHNKDGFDTNSQNSADAPSPQDGACPNGGTGPTGTHSCWVFEYNYVHDNNNPNVPASGEAALGPIGTGLSIAGGRNDTVVHNRFVNNGSWGVLTTAFPDTSPAAASNVPNCRGGVLGGALLGLTLPCLYDVWGNEIADNTFIGNGGFGNPTNGDIADLAPPPVEQLLAPGDCFHGNVNGVGLPASTWPVTAQTLQSRCGLPVYPDPVSDAALLAQVACASAAFGSCPAGLPPANYPQATAVVMPALSAQPSMPDPCAGVPVANPWCPLD